jgi:hypothetical protein
MKSDDQPWGYRGMMMLGNEYVEWEHQRALRAGFPLDNIKFEMERIFFDSL